MWSELGVWISTDSISYDPVGQASTDCTIFRPSVHLFPGETFQYKVRILHAHQRASCFERPGEYYLTIRLDLGSLQNEPPSIVESNIVRVEVRRPIGQDARFQKSLAQSEMPLFLTYPFRDNGKTAVKICELIRRYPASAYNASLREALWEYYVSGKWELTQPQMSVVRRTIGVKTCLEADDSRLKIDLSDCAGNCGTVKAVLAALSAESGVALSACKDLTSEHVRLSALDTRLDLCLDSIAVQIRGYWVQRGSGYYLCRDPL